MDDGARLEEAVRALNNLLRDVDGGGPLAQIGTTSPAAASTASPRVVASPQPASSQGRSVLETLSAFVPSGGLASQLAGAVTGESAKESNSVASTVLGFLGKGFGLAPAVSAIFRLFGGGGEEEPVDLPRYVAPSPIRVEAANTPSAGTGLDFTPVRYAQGNLPGPAATVQTASEKTQVVVQVNAMDSRSFLDHSDDIARAVREAMLNMHPLNDVVSDL